MKKITITQLARKIFDLPAGRTLHFKRYSDRDLYGVVRHDLFDCDTIQLSYYGGLNTSVFDASVEHTAQGIASWVADVIGSSPRGSIYFLDEDEVLPRGYELWGVTFRTADADGRPYRTLAISECSLFPIREEADSWIADRPNGPFDSAFPAEKCSDPQAVLIDRWREKSSKPL